MAFAIDEWPRLERPVEIDPLRDYDRLDRNQPRRLGFMELVARPFPWILRAFTGRVPDDFIAQVGVNEIEVPCPCKAVTPIAFNVATPCEGDCGRWFWYFGGVVRVAYVSSLADDHDDEDQQQRDEGDEEYRDGRE